jgi:hypothetical protein
MSWSRDWLVRVCILIRRIDYLSEISATSFWRLEVEVRDFGPGAFCYFCDLPEAFAVG